MDVMAKDGDPTLSGRTQLPLQIVPLRETAGTGSDETEIDAGTTEWGAGTAAGVDRTTDLAGSATATQPKARVSRRDRRALAERTAIERRAVPKGIRRERRARKAATHGRTRERSRSDRR